MLKRFVISAVLLGAFLAGSAYALDNATGTKIGSQLVVKSKTFTVADSLATNVAALTATSGLEMDRGGAVASTLSAESTRTITGGTMRCYVYMPVSEGAGTVTYRWFAYTPLDWTPATGQRDAASGDKQMWSGIGRIVWLPDAVTVSGGTTVVATISIRKGLPITP